MSKAFAVDAGRFEPVYRAAERDGLAPALQALGSLLGEEPPAHRAGGIAVLTGHTVPAADARLAGYDLPGGVVAFARRPDAAGGAGPAWHRGLLWLRLGSSVGRRRECLRRLASRRVNGTEIVHQQLVKGQLADVLLGHQEIAAALDPAPTMPAVVRRRIHEQITSVDRAVLGLFGADGFLLRGPGAVAQVSELLADVYGRHPDDTATEAGTT